MEQDKRWLVNGKELKLGTCYYPDHWDRSLWAQDLQRMLEAGIKVIRIAEFAWSKVEPVSYTHLAIISKLYVQICLRRSRSRRSCILLMWKRGSWGVRSIRLYI